MKTQQLSTKLMSAKAIPTALIALLLSATSLSRPLAWIPASAQPLPPPPASGSPRVSGSAVVPAGTEIPVRFEKSEKIVVARGETLPLTLIVDEDIRDAKGTLRDRNGNLLIPAGSKVVGQIEPAGQGARFVAQRLQLSQNRRLSLEATSATVTRSETINEGASAGQILGGTLAGAGAATLIAGVTGDRRINALEVLSGAAIGAFAGWALPSAGAIGGNSKEVISIDPNSDLTLTVQSDLYLTSNRSNSSNFSNGSRRIY
jgi:hypothetical protein